MNSLLSFYQEAGKTLLTLYAGDEVIAECSICDPFLCAYQKWSALCDGWRFSLTVHNILIVTAVRAFDSGSLQSRYVEASKGLRESKTYLLLARQTFPSNSMSNDGHGMVQNGWQADGHATQVAVVERSSTRAAQFLSDDNLMKVVEFPKIDRSFH